VPLGPKMQRHLRQHRRTKWVWTNGFSSGVWKWEYFCTVECQRLQSSKWMEQQQKKCNGPVRCVCEEQPAAEHRMSTEPEVVHGTVPARWDTLEWLWSAPWESVEPLYRWPAASPEASVASEAVAWRRWDSGSGRQLWPGCSGCAVVCQKSPPVRHSTAHCSSLAWKRRHCTRLSGRRRQSVEYARGAECKCGSSF